MESSSNEENYKQCRREWGCLAVRAITKVNYSLPPGLARKICRRPRCYCCSLIVLSQVVIAVWLTRINASSKEQKERTPVAEFNGEAMN